MSYPPSLCSRCVYRDMSLRTSGATVSVGQLHGLPGGRLFSSSYFCCTKVCFVSRGGKRLGFNLGFSTCPGKSSSLYAGKTDLFFYLSDGNTNPNDVSYSSTRLMLTMDV